jgi:hypothetical protein
LHVATGELWPLGIRDVIMRKLTWLHYLVIVIIFWSYMLLTQPFGSNLIIVLCVASVLLTLPVFFSAKRDSNQKASKFETTLATVWLWVRRIVCFAGGAFLVFFGILIALNFWTPGPQQNYRRNIFRFYWHILFFVGFKGQGSDRSRLSDDIQLHEKNRRRYKWK